MLHRRSFAFLLTRWCVVTRFSTTSTTPHFLAQLSKRVRQSWIDVKIVQWTDGGSVVDP